MMILRPRPHFNSLCSRVLLLLSAKIPRSIVEHKIDSLLSARKCQTMPRGCQLSIDTLTLFFFQLCSMLLAVWASTASSGFVGGRARIAPTLAKWHFEISLCFITYGAVVAIASITLECDLATVFLFVRRLFFLFIHFEIVQKASGISKYTCRVRA